MKDTNMKCNSNDIRELLPDLAAGLADATPEVNDHLRSCAACTGTLAEFRKTMALLDEWQAPEPSPYFDVRLAARLREEAAKQPAGWWAWAKRPALAISLALALVAGVSIIRNGGGKVIVNSGSTVANAGIEPGTAVVSARTAHDRQFNENC
jgi:anti-sigma factor RsiW